MLNHLKHHFGSRRTGGHGGLDIARHIGPGLLVTVGFIDPGNWASNMAAGSQFGYALLWIVTLSTIMLIVLQHNAAHLGIATGMCLAEATTRHLPRLVGRVILGSAYLATVATAMAEVLGGAIALQMLFGLPVRAGCIIVAAASIAMLMTSSYKRAEHGSSPSWAWWDSRFWPSLRWSRSTGRKPPQAGSRPVCPLALPRLS